MSQITSHIFKTLTSQNTGNKLENVSGFIIDNDEFVNPFFAILNGAESAIYELMDTNLEHGTIFGVPDKFDYFESDAQTLDHIFTFLL